MTALLYLLLAALVLLFLSEMRHSLRRSNAAFTLVEKYEHDLGNPVLVDEIASFIESDWKLRRVMRRERGTREDIRQLIKHLMLWGNVRKGRRFVPITSFFYVCSLSYLLRHKDAEPKQLAMKMMNYLHI